MAAFLVAHVPPGTLDSSRLALGAQGRSRCWRFFRDGPLGADALTPAVIADNNRRVLKGTLMFMDEGAVPGEVRQHSVGVGGYRGAPAQDCDYLLERLCAWLTKGAFHTEGADRRMAYVVIKACIAHVYLAWIHPFGDGNGRTERLVEFHILVEAGVPLAAAHLLSNHYNLTRARYYQELARASATRASGH